jgi:hypothetical protein
MERLSWLDPASLVITGHAARTDNLGCPAVAAASLWVVGGPLIGAVDGSFNPLLESIFALIPAAMFGGLAAGAVTGALLEAFGFDWVV